MIITCKDGKVFNTEADKVRLLGSADKVRSREVHKPAVLGEFPVFIEQSGSYRIFTYSRKIAQIQGAIG